MRLDQVLAVDLDPPCGASAAPPNCHPIRKTGGRRTYRNALRLYIFLAACVRPTSVGFSRHAIRRESGTRVFEFCPCVASRHREASGRAKETGVEIARDDYSILPCVCKRFCLRKLFAILQIRWTGKERWKLVFAPMLDGKWNDPWKRRMLYGRASTTPVDCARCDTPPCICGADWLRDECFAIARAVISSDQFFMSSREYWEGHVKFDLWYFVLTANTRGTEFQHSIEYVL